MELDPYAQRLLDLTREARTPSAADRLRVDRALSAALGFAVTSSIAPVLSASTGAGVGSGVATTAAVPSTTAALVFKWTAGLALVASAITAGYYQLRPTNTPAPSEQPAKVAPPAAPVEAPAPIATAEAEAPEPAPKPARRAAEGGRTSETLAEELDLLHDAQAKWRNRNPAGALALLAQHRQRYPKSALGQEREALRVLSLCAAGRTDEAKAVARRSFRNAPKSPLRATVDESCVKD